MSKVTDYYSILAIPRDASPEEIRRAYHRAARIMHPDVNLEADSQDRFLKVQNAYEVLSDPIKRSEYDLILPSDDQLGLTITIETTYSRRFLAKINEPQIAYVLLDLIAPPNAKKRPAPPINVCMAIDRSTSMQGRRMDTVKATAIELLHQLRPKDILSIVTFSDRSEVLISASHRLEPHQIEAQIMRIQASGGTEIYHGLEAAFFEVRSKFSDKNINHIILLTDGHTYGDEKACLRLADQTAAFGIGISSLGIGSEWNDAFLDNLTMRTGGSSMYVSKPSTINQFLQQKVSSLSHIYAERATLDLNIQPGIELLDAFRLSPDANPLQVSSPIPIGNIPLESALSIVLEFKISPIHGNMTQLTLAEGKLTSEIPGRDPPSYRLPIYLSRPIDKASDTQTPTRLLKAISRLTLYRLQERAHKSLEDGQTEDASRHLKNLATHLFSEGEDKLAQVVLYEADNVRNHRPISEQGRKEIKYGTRALLLPAALSPPGAHNPT
jgi:Ca-activated chloride channel family protein